MQWFQTNNNQNQQPQRQQQQRQARSNYGEQSESRKGNGERREYSEGNNNQNWHRHRQMIQPRRGQQFRNTWNPPPLILCGQQQQQPPQQYPFQYRPTFFNQQQQQNTFYTENFFGPYFGNTAPRNPYYPHIHPYHTHGSWDTRRKQWIPPVWEQNNVEKHQDQSDVTGSSSVLGQICSFPPPPPPPPPSGATRSANANSIDNNFVDNEEPPKPPNDTNVEAQPPFFTTHQEDHQQQRKQPEEGQRVQQKQGHFEVEGAGAALIDRLVRPNVVDINFQEERRQQSLLSDQVPPAVPIESVEHSTTNKVQDTQQCQEKNIEASQQEQLVDDDFVEILNSDQGDPYVEARARAAEDAAAENEVVQAMLMLKERSLQETVAEIRGLWEAYVEVKPELEEETTAVPEPCITCSSALSSQQQERDQEADLSSSFVGTDGAHNTSETNEEGDEFYNHTNIKRPRIEKEQEPQILPSSQTSSVKSTNTTHQNPQSTQQKQPPHQGLQLLPENANEEANSCGNRFSDVSADSLHSIAVDTASNSASSPSLVLSKMRTELEHVLTPYQNEKSHSNKDANQHSLNSARVQQSEQESSNAITVPDPTTTANDEIEKTYETAAASSSSSSKEPSRITKSKESELVVEGINVQHQKKQQQQQQREHRSKESTVPLGRLLKTSKTSAFVSVGTQQKQQNEKPKNVSDGDKRGQEKKDKKKKKKDDNLSLQCSNTSKKRITTRSPSKKRTVGRGKTMTGSKNSSKPKNPLYPEPRTCPICRKFSTYHRQKFSNHLRKIGLKVSEVYTNKGVRKQIDPKKLARLLHIGCSAATSSSSVEDRSQSEISQEHGDEVREEEEEEELQFTLQPFKTENIPNNQNVDNDFPQLGSLNAEAPQQPMEEEHLAEQSAHTDFTVHQNAAECLVPPTTSQIKTEIIIDLTGDDEDDVHTSSRTERQQQPLSTLCSEGIQPLPQNLHQSREKSQNSYYRCTICPLRNHLYFYSLQDYNDHLAVSHPPQMVQFEKVLTFINNQSSDNGEVRAHRHPQHSQQHQHPSSSRCPTNSNNNNNNSSFGIGPLREEPNQLTLQQHPKMSMEDFDGSPTELSEDPPHGK